MQEIRVRVALGAASRDIWASVVGQGMAFAGLGIASRVDPMVALRYE